MRNGRETEAKQPPGFEDRRANQFDTACNKLFPSPKEVPMIAKRIALSVAGLTVVLGACGSTTTSTKPAAAPVTTIDKAMADKKAMEDKAMAEKKAMEDKAMAEKKAMEDKAMADKKAMEDKAMADKKAMEDKAMADKSAEEKAMADKTAEEKAMADKKAMSDKAMADAAPWQKLSINDVTGKAFALTDFHDKEVYVENFATWCPNCKKQLGNVQKAAAANPDAIFIAYSVETDLSAEKVAAYAKDNGFTNIRFAVMTPEMLAAMSSALGKDAINPPSTPHFVIGKSGKPGALKTGYEDDAAITASIKTAMTA
jgi:thiol-disulfide isomerase/thioredoxin